MQDKTRLPSEIEHAFQVRPNLPSSEIEPAFQVGLNPHSKWDLTQIESGFESTF